MYLPMGLCWALTVQTTDSTNGWLYNPIPRIISNNYAKEYEQIDTLCLSYILMYLWIMSAVYSKLNLRFISAFWSINYKANFYWGINPNISEKGTQTQ